MASGLTIFLAWTFALSGLPIGAAEGNPLSMLILESKNDEPLKVVTGETSRLDQPESAASTFKIWLTALALEEKILTRSSRYDCCEPHLYHGKKARVGLRQALILSSNDFFREVASRLGLKKLNQGLASLHLTPKPQTRSVRSIAAAIHGDRFRVTPRQQHEAMRALVLGSLPVSRETRQTLREALEWPVPENAHWRVYGKTGCYGGAVWFVGWGESRPTLVPSGAIASQPRPEVKIVTVFAPGNLTQRPEVMRQFFRRFGIDWSDTLLQGLGATGKLPDSTTNTGSEPAATGTKP
ncbi:MAG TPA: penicillin-binding transpeptidase domain-containing protein [Candidatus Ozemobacteraceae bacterium]|nr:penicillin-binding transpeptidase domain-containing protein [Candidatus Ozemobacteraceae bacterium]